MMYIKNWLLKNTGLPFVLKKYLNDMGLGNKTVYVVNDRKDLLNKWIKSYDILKPDLINNQPSYEPSLFNEIIKYYSTAQHVSGNDFSYTGIIINPGTSIDEIFSLLHWPYEEPVFKNDKYIIEARNSYYNRRGTKDPLGPRLASRTKSRNSN